MWFITWVVFSLIDFRFVEVRVENINYYLSKFKIYIQILLNTHIS